jgi:hypothetical protein
MQPAVELDQVSKSFRVRRAPRLGVRPSNRGDNHIPSCCAPALSVAALGDGPVGVLCAIAPEEPIDLPVTRTGDTA